MSTTLQVEERSTTLQGGESDGLCSTCNNAPGCYYRATRGPALFCEMFDDYSAPVELAVTEARPLYTKQAEENDFSGGLCVNCSRRHDCMYRRSAAGVWHCEDYG